MTAVSNAGPLIHFAQIGRLFLLKDIFGRIILPSLVKVEVVDAGKKLGKPDAFLIEGEIGRWIEVCDNPGGVEEIASRAGIHAGEAAAILVAREKGLPVLLDDIAARRFAAGLRLEIAGSVGVLIKAVKMGLIAKNEAVESLESLSEVMWMNAVVFERARRVIESME
ncbi:hypothetical protein [Archaeoglobus veneficus]|uniref:DUF3368 domain-containing protein n=1 Tax=Archaeoglobus veneficus (strain DSM 11195 / SNP6) TaxID=693661 RepID=F2KNM0_ARCVS|nr:hypothetical protein [Archaeoglobus veneficus]AEA46248.1 hypothetical protein Arcve_0211 [Archaeoglobus veneficus SNP6]